MKGEFSSWRGGKKVEDESRTMNFIARRLEMLCRRAGAGRRDERIVGFLWDRCCARGVLEFFEREIERKEVVGWRSC